MSQTRRLAAILAADVAGYSRLMIRAEVTDPKTASREPDDMTAVIAIDI